MNYMRLILYNKGELSLSSFLHIIVLVWAKLDTWQVIFFGSLFLFLRFECWASYFVFCYYSFLDFGLLQDVFVQTNHV